MKLFYTLVLLIAGGAATADKMPVFGEGPLHDDLNEILSLLPLNEIGDVIIAYAEDEQFQQFTAILVGEENKAFLKDLQSFPECRAIMDYLHNAGIYIYEYVNVLNRYLGLDPLPVPTRPAKPVPYKITGGLNGFVADIAALIPTEAINRLSEQKLRTSKAFADFIEFMRSDVVLRLNDKILQNEHYANVVKQIMEIGGRPAPYVARLSLHEPLKQAFKLAMPILNYI